MLPPLPPEPPGAWYVDEVRRQLVAQFGDAAVDTAGASPGLDWLDGPTLLVGGARRSDLTWPVLRLVENADPAPLRSWLAAVGVRLEKPVRLA